MEVDRILVRVEEEAGILMAPFVDRTDVLFVAVIIILVLVELIQFIGNKISANMMKRR